jgi:outer membrane protein OmpA-like peptidoglycan-associated protein
VKPIAVVFVAALAAACSTLSPQAERQLEAARASYRTASADLGVRQHAQPELAAARSALQDAERMAGEGADSTLVEHHAYLAEQRARTALTSAQARQAQAQIAAQREERLRAERAQLEKQAADARARAEQAEVARLEAEGRAQAAQQERLKMIREKTAAAELAAEVKRLEAEGADVSAKHTERGWILTLRNELLFESGTTLKESAARALDNLAAFMRKYPDRVIAIEGFADTTGPRDAAERLSERRAQAVKFALVERGIEPHRMDARGYGASFPVASSETETGRSLNSRVEIVIDPS